MTHYKTFAEVSDAEPADIQEMRDFFRDLPKLPDNGFEAAKTVRHYLIEKGFEYDDDVFTLQDMARNKRGNCLGLSLLIASGGNLKYKKISFIKTLVLRPLDLLPNSFTRDLPI